ncbi:MAG TPA: hypothetical protein VGM91_20200 [Conexibacter sp.]
MVGHEFRGDRSGKLQPGVRLVVGGGHVEGLEDLRQPGFVRRSERVAHVGDRVEHCRDLVRARSRRPLRSQRRNGFRDRRGASAQLLDPSRCERDDGVVRIVVLFEPQHLPLKAAVDIASLPLKPVKLGVVISPRVSFGRRQLGAQQAQAPGAEDPFREEVENGVEHLFLLDAKHLGVTGGNGGGAAAATSELAAVPVGTLLVAAFHPSAAERTVHTPAQDVEAARSAAGAMRVIVELRGPRSGLVARRAFLNGLVEGSRHDRGVGRRRAPDPLLARSNYRSSPALVVPVPDVVAGVLRVAQHRVELRSAPGLHEGVLVLAVALGRRVAVEVAVELVDDFAESEAMKAVVLVDHQDDRSSDRVDDELVLELALARLVRVGVLVRFEGEAVRDRAARVPALPDAFLHPAPAFLDQVAYVPLGDALLHAAGEDRGRVGDHRLVCGEEADVELFKLALDPGGVGGHAREAVDALDNHGIEPATVPGASAQIREAAVTRDRDAERGAVGAAPAFRKILTAALDVPEVGDDLAADRFDRAPARRELAGDRQRRVLCVLGRDAAVERVLQGGWRGGGHSLHLDQTATAVARSRADTTAVALRRTAKERDHHPKLPIATLDIGVAERQHSGRHVQITRLAPSHVRSSQRHL